MESGQYHNIIRERLVHVVSNMNMYLSSGLDGLLLRTGMAF